MFRKSKKYDGPLPIVDMVIASGRYDRKNRLLRDAVTAYISKEGVNLHTGTEASAEDREKVLRQVGRAKDWGVLTGDQSYRDDSYDMWDIKVWEVLHKKTYRVSTGDIFTGKGSRMPKNSTAIVVLEHRESRHRLVLAAGHPPSGVERGGRIEWSKRGIAWRIEVADQKRIANKIARKWKADGVIINNDWNADAKKKANRDTIKHIMPMWKFGVRAPHPKGGTLGNRWIDFAMFRRALRFVKSWLMQDDEASDHRPTRVQLQFTKAPRNYKGWK